MAPALVFPERTVPLTLRALRANRSFLTEEAARQDMRDLALRPASYGPPRLLRRDVSVAVERRNGRPLYTVRPTKGSASGAVVYAHGGGWINEIAAAHWHLVAQIAAEAGTTVLVPIYPLAPEGTAAEVVTEFADIVMHGERTYGDTRLVGDSAGGQIALSAALLLRDRHAHRLSRTILISPALDLTWSNPGIPAVQPSDRWLAVPGGRVRAEAWRGSLPLTDPLVSPIFGDLSGLGPVTIFIGTHDILNPDAHLLLEKARAAGTDVELHEGERLVHVYPLLPTRTGAHARQLIIERLRGSTEPREIDPAS